MSDINDYSAWQIVRGDVLHGTPASILRRHVEHLRYWAGKAFTQRAATAISDIADELDLVQRWAIDNQPRDERVHSHPVYQSLPPDQSSG